MFTVFSLTTFFNFPIPVTSPNNGHTLSCNVPRLSRSREQGPVRTLMPQVLDCTAHTFHFLSLFYRAGVVIGYTSVLRRWKVRRGGRRTEVWEATCGRAQEKAAWKSRSGLKPAMPWPPSRTSSAQSGDTDDS